jgi:hypothetical protein
VEQPSPDQPSAAPTQSGIDIEAPPEYEQIGAGETAEEPAPPAAGAEEPTAATEPQAPAGQAEAEPEAPAAEAEAEPPAAAEPQPPTADAEPEAPAAQAEPEPPAAAEPEAARDEEVTEP